MRSCILSCITGYLIQSSYIEMQLKSLYQLEHYKFSDKTYDENDFIEIRVIGHGSSFNVSLNYNIDNCSLFAIKKAMGSDNEIEKLSKREYNNYLNIKYPLLPKYIGKIKNGNYYNLVIQYIDGQTLQRIIENRQTLQNTKIIQLDYNDKIIIIFQLILVINYFHKNNFVYRDLKPNNVIINTKYYRFAFVIDFDRLIRISDEFQDENNEHTKNFTDFAAPEVNLGEVSYKNDIFSIGKMIYYIINEGYTSNPKNYDLEKNRDLYNIYKKCINEKPEQRPSIQELMIDFYMCFISIINKSFLFAFDEIFEIRELISKCINNSNDISFYSKQNEINNYNLDINKIIYYFSLSTNQNNSWVLFCLGIIYYKYRNINKSINYLTLASNKNYTEAQYNLGKIYYEGKYIARDINKAIYYFSLAANQNDSNSQFILGYIFYKGIYIQQDIGKAIYYFSSAAKQNDILAILALGLIYYEGIYAKRDINKAINLITIAANQNEPEAQFRIAYIYDTGEYVKKNINKSIHYYTLAANNNIIEAQHNLGYIYYEGIYITRDINKAIYYFTLAADQNYPGSLYNLAVIYYDGKYVKRDMNKAIQYLISAANLNFSYAQYILGLIYFNGIYVKQEISKSINYFILAANQNHTQAQLVLFQIFVKGKYIRQNYKKAIYYLTLAANQNDSCAQCILGILNIEGIFVEKNTIKGMKLLIQSSENGYIESHFIVGFFYHEGKIIERNIKKMIYYYKEASSFNSKYAKNNLGVIYKNGIDNKIPKNIGFAQTYFDEAIRRYNDSLSMYNLSHIYIYEDQMEEKIDESIILLIKSFNQSFLPALYLLCIALIKKNGINAEAILQDLQNKTDKSSNLSPTILNIIIQKKLYIESNFKNFFQYYKNIDYIYNFFKGFIQSNQINMNLSRNTTAIDISSDFYEGFGNDI